jgi:hypothetical protein
VPLSESSNSILRSIASVLAVLGIALYAYLTYIYQRFYSALDVTPSDVGFTYATTLARSIGLIVAALITYLGLIGLRWFLGGLAVTAMGDFVGPLIVIPLAVILWIVLPFVLYPLTEPAREADISAKQVMVGLPVAPVRLYGVTIMDFRADSAAVAANGQPGASPAMDTLAATPGLVYLGRSEGVVVLYDSVNDQPVQVPANAAIMRLQRPVARQGRSPVCVLSPAVREWWQKPLVGPLRGWRPLC